MTGQNNSNKWNLRPFQDEVLKIFKVFDAICKKYDLRYYADGGTALGAIRHGGFIPWDDDFDVDVPRNDFNKLIEILPKELPPHMRLRRGGETKHSPIHFFKIIDEREGIMDDLSKRTNLEVDIEPFIDVFALDGIPTQVTELSKWWRGRRMLRMCQLYRYPNSAMASGGKWALKNVLARFAGFFISWFVSKTANNEEMMRLVDRYAMRWAYDESKMVVEPAFFRMRTRYIFPKEMFEGVRELPFEDTTIRVPYKLEDYLTRFFNDYMQLPPEDCRVPEHLFKRAWNHV